MILTLKNGLRLQIQQKLTKYRYWLMNLLLLEIFRFYEFPRDRPFGGHCLPSMLDFDAICGVPAHLALIELSSEVDFERYLWCSRALGHFIVCLRCLTLTLFVVAGSTFRNHCFYSMLDFFVDALLRFVLLAKARAQLWFMKYTQHCANLVTCERIAMILSY